jgi:hypothetical protein
MTTFTLQDLTPEQQVAVNNHEEMHKMFNEIGSVFVGEGKTSVMDEVRALGQTIADNTKAEAQAGTLDAPEPQPSQIDPIRLIDEMMSQFSIKLKLLATVISQSKAQPDGNISPDITLQETISLTLQQADWFKDLIRVELVALDISEIAKDAVENIVENEVESYFDNRFDPSDHFDFGDAVSNEVDDRLDDVVRDRVMDSLEEVVAEKLSEASIKVEFN